VAFYQSHTSLALTLGMFLLSGFFQLLARPAFLEVTVSWVRGTICSATQAFSVFSRSGKDLLLLNLFEQGVVVLMPGILVLVAAVVSSSVIRASAGQGIAALCLLVCVALAGALSLFVGVRFAFSFPALQFERLHWFPAVKRSWGLTRGFVARLLLLWGIVFLTGLVINTTIRWTAYFVLNALALRWLTWGHGLAYSVAYALGSAAVSLVIAPVYPIAITLLYYDQRIRREGLDIEWSMRAAGMELPQAVTAPAGGETA